jgi:hypothetical protein
MNEENINSINSLPEKMDEIISQFQNDILITGALLKNKKFYNDFDSVLSDLNQLVSENEDTPQKFVQISMF